MKDQRGFALVITLLVTALLVALTAEFVDEVYVDTSSRQSFVDGEQASLMAGSGMTTAIRLLTLGLGMQDYSALTDLDRLEGMLKIEDERGTLQVTAEEESGKLDLNALVNPNGSDNETCRQIAQRLFVKLGLPPQLLDAVADWIGTNEVPRPGGAKSAYYQTLKPPYAAKGAKLDTFEELRLVKGFDAKTMERLRPFLTVYPAVRGGYATAPVNINTAPKELIASLDAGMTDNLAQQIVDERKVRPFKTATDLGNRISGMTALSLAMASDSRIMQQEKGAVFRIVSRAQVKETVRIVEAVVRIGEQTPLYWREY